MRLGAIGDEAYYGTLTPSGTTYQLGGGGGVLNYYGPLTGANSLDVGLNGTQAGTVILAGTMTYTGSTVINAGTLVVHGAIAPTSILVGQGAGSNATLVVGPASTANSGNAQIGADAGSVGSVLVSGSISTWTNSAGMAVGNTGTGSLTIDTGGKVSNLSDLYIANDTSGNGTLTVTDPGSKLSVGGSLYVGLLGTGSLNIQNGATVTSNNGYIGNNASSTGTATVTGAGSLWNNNANIFVGYSGSGVLNILSGGTVSNGGNGYFYIGGGTSGVGTVTVSGSGSVLNVPLGMAVGSRGTLNILNGGTVVDNIGYVGDLNASQALVTIDGASSSWINTGYLNIGNSGGASVTVQNGGFLLSQGIVYVDSPASALLTVTGSGSKVVSGDAVVVGDNGNGVLNIQNGGAIVSARGSIGNNPGSAGIVTVSDPGSSWTMSGTLSFAGTGALTINGGTVQAGGFDTSGAVMATINLNGGVLQTPAWKSQGQRAGAPQSGKIEGFTFCV